MKEGKAILITVKPRIHICLLSMQKGGVRKNGGVGFAINSPVARLVVRQSNDFSYSEVRPKGFEEEQVEELLLILKSAAKRHSLGDAIHVTVDGQFRTHVGMGSDTAIRLAALEGMFYLNERKIGRNELVRLSRRGGTSGIGINTYFSGGLVLDLGISRDNVPLAPSAQIHPRALPLRLPTVSMASWPIRLCIPKCIPVKSRQEEADFFTRTTPIPRQEAFEASYEAIFGVYASAWERDFTGFCRSISALQQTSWKRQEWEQYGCELGNIGGMLRELGASAVGLSSLGPMLYCFGDGTTLVRISENAHDLRCEVYETLPSNSGRDIVECGFVTC